MEEIKKSTHRVDVVPLVLEKHSNADTLSVAKVYGFTCVTGTSQWEGKTSAAYIPPDSLVDVNRPEFSFLAKDAKADGKARIKAKKIRGVLSFGLLVPAPEGAQVGDDVAELLNIEHYDPAPRGSENRGGLFTGGDVASPPDVYVVKYDIDAGRRYASDVFQPDEPVWIDEKIHGCNSRFVFNDCQMFAGSRTEWKKEYPSYEHVTVESLVATGKVDESRATEIINKLKDEPRKKNLWWQALDATPKLREFCENNPGVVVYGEVYGAVQDLNYGFKKGEVAFAAFDIMVNGQWMDVKEQRYKLCEAGVPVVPTIEEHIPFDFDMVCGMAEGKTKMSGAEHVREGVVVRPLRERFHPSIGRTILKWVGAGYLERSK